jgi:endogenous inhibitor of DNA gyrase (YacG/DUF329 family)
MTWLLDCPICGQPMSRPDGDPERPLDCDNRCRQRTSTDDWVAARWRQLEDNQ